MKLVSSLRTEYPLKLVLIFFLFLTARDIAFAQDFSESDYERYLQYRDFEISDIQGDMIRLQRAVAAECWESGNCSADDIIEVLTLRIIVFTKLIRNIVISPSPEICAVCRNLSVEMPCSSEFRTPKVIRDISTEIFGEKEYRIVDEFDAHSENVQYQTSMQFARILRNRYCSSTVDSIAIRFLNGEYSFEHTYGFGLSAGYLPKAFYPSKYVAVAYLDKQRNVKRVDSICIKTEPSARCEKKFIRNREFYWNPAIRAIFDTRAVRAGSYESGIDD